MLRIPTESHADFIMAGLLPWIFSAGALTASTEAIVGNAGLIRKVYFPREIFPTASVLFSFTQLPPQDHRRDLRADGGPRG